MQTTQMLDAGTLPPVFDHAPAQRDADSHGTPQKSVAASGSAVGPSGDNEQQGASPNPCDCARCRGKRALLQQLTQADRTVRAEGLRRVPIRGDGNCQFRALAAFFPHRAVTHAAVRALIVDYIEQHADQFRLHIVEGLDYPTVERYCADMRRDGTWGDGITLMAFCLSQNVNIVVFTEAGRNELHPGDGRPKMGLVCVGQHYEATRVVAKNGNVGQRVDHAAQMSALSKHQ